MPSTDERLDALEGRLDKLEECYDNLSNRVSAVEQKVDSFKNHFDARFDAIEDQLKLVIKVLTKD